MLRCQSGPWPSHAMHMPNSTSYHHTHHQSRYSQRPGPFTMLRPCTNNCTGLVLLLKPKQHTLTAMLKERIFTNLRPESTATQGQQQQPSSQHHTAAGTLAAGNARTHHRRTHIRLSILCAANSQAHRFCFHNHTIILPSQYPHTAKLYRPQAQHPAASRLPCSSAHQLHSLSTATTPGPNRTGKGSKRLTAALLVRCTAHADMPGYAGTPPPKHKVARMH